MICRDGMALASVAFGLSILLAGASADPAKHSPEEDVMDSNSDHGLVFGQDTFMPWRLGDVRAKDVIRSREGEGVTLRWYLTGHEEAGVSESFRLLLSYGFDHTHTCYAASMSATQIVFKPTGDLEPLIERIVGVLGETCVEARLGGGHRREWEVDGVDVLLETTTHDIRGIVYDTALLTVVRSSPGESEGREPADTGLADGADVATTATAPSSPEGLDADILHRLGVLPKAVRDTTVHSMLRHRKQNNIQIRWTTHGYGALDIGPEVEVHVMYSFIGGLDNCIDADMTIYWEQEDAWDLCEAFEARMKRALGTPAVSRENVWVWGRSEVGSINVILRTYKSDAEKEDEKRARAQLAVFELYSRAAAARIHGEKACE